MYPVVSDAVTKDDGLEVGDLVILLEDLEHDHRLQQEPLAKVGEIGIIVEIITRHDDDMITCCIMVPNGSAHSRVFKNEVIKFRGKDAQEVPR